MTTHHIKPFPSMYLREGGPQTQKAKGLDSIIHEYDIFGWGDFCVPRSIRNSLLVKELDKIDILNASDILDWLRKSSTFLARYFIRPCPRTPKHGFVESRVFDNPQTLVDTARETLEADPLGEIIIQEYIPADYSAVINPNCITIGRGTDGVTSGKEETITFSTFDRREAPWTCNSFVDLYEQKAIACEVLRVKGNNRWNVVQMREISPKIGTARTRYVPKDFMVTRIISIANINPNNLMMRIFAKVSPRKAETTFFTVNTMRSHNAMQMIEAGYAVGEKNPMVFLGDEMKKTTDEILSSPTKDLEDLALLLRGYMTKSVSTLLPDKPSESGRRVLASWASRTAKISLDLDLGMEGDRISLSLGIVSMLYMSILACVGEARHFFFMSPGGMSYGGLPHCIFKHINSSIFMTIYPRTLIYEGLSNYKLPQLLAVASRVLPMLEARWTRGYGGAAWSKILRTNLSMYEKIRQFIDSPTSKTLISLLNKYNEASYLTHNGGSGPLFKFGAMHKTELEILGDLGIDVLENPPVRKKGKLPRFRESTLPLKMSRKRKWPPFSELEHPNARVRIQLKGLRGSYGGIHVHPDYKLIDPHPPSLPYVILLPDRDWKESNCPWGFLISGLIRLSDQTSINILNNSMKPSTLNLQGVTFFDGGWKTTGPSPIYENIKNIQILRKKDFAKQYILDALPSDVAYCTRQYYLTKDIRKKIPSMFVT